MYATQNRKPAPVFAFGNSSSSIRVLGDDITPARELRAVLPVDVVLRAARKGDVDRFFVDTLVIGAEKFVDNPGHLQAVINGFAGEEPSCAESQVMHAAADSLPHIRSSSFGQVLSDDDGIPSRHDEQFVGRQLAHTHAVQLARGQSGVRQAKRTEE